MRLNEQAENRSRPGPACRPLSALNPQPPSHPAQAMIPENWYSWYTNLTHVSRTAKHKINYILWGLQISIFAHWKGTLHDRLNCGKFSTPPTCTHTPDPDYQKDSIHTQNQILKYWYWTLIKIVRRLVRAICLASVKLEACLQSPDLCWHFIRGLLLVAHHSPAPLPHPTLHCPIWWKLMDYSISIWGSQLRCQPILISFN